MEKQFIQKHRNKNYNIMENKEFNEWCYNNEIPRPQNNSEELDRTMTIEEFYYLLLNCFEAGQNSARKE